MIKPVCINSRMPEPTIRARLGRRFDPSELRDIKRLWVRHSIAEDARDIDGLLATLTDDAVYEIVPTTRSGTASMAPAPSTQSCSRRSPTTGSSSPRSVGPQGVFEAARLTGTNLDRGLERRHRCRSISRS